jgi:hypothetical protein
MEKQTGPVRDSNRVDGELIPSHGVCACCGETRPGRPYHYYFGWKLGQANGAAHLAESKITRTKTSYRVGGNESYFLCQPCIRRLNRLANIGTLLALIPVGLFLTGFGLYIFIPMISNGSNTWWQPLTCAFCPGVFLFLAGIPTIRSMVEGGKKEGEKAAIRLARRKKLHEPECVYWTTKEFEKLK